MHSRPPCRVDGAKVRDANDCILAHVYGHGSVAADAPLQANNAALFAASPDLLAACKTALHCLTEGDVTMYRHEESPYHFLFAAIAKATGEQIVPADEPEVSSEEKRT